MTLLDRMGKSVLAVGSILLILLILTIVFFASIEPRFLSLQNVFNVARQSVYLMVISMGVMLVLITGNFDLSIGSNVALVSVVSTLVMINASAAYPNDPGWAVALGMAAGLGVGAAVGLFNGIGVAVLNVNSFIMTLGSLSIVFGIALMITGGLPIYGAPKQFIELFSYGRLFEIPVPVIIAAGLFAILLILLDWTPFGRHLYAVGSNRRAARLSGINTTRILILANVLCGVVVAIGGLLLTARVGTGEPRLGEDLPLTALTACVLGGVSLWGGTGRLGGVILGALFISLLSNGMNLIGVSSHAQIGVTGSALILAVVADQVRLRLIGRLRVD